MTFDDLPAQWSDLPLTTQPLLDDVLDLVVGIRDRLAGSLVVLICDADVRLLQPLAIGEWPTAYDPVLVDNLVTVVVEAFGHVERGSLILAFARRQGLAPTPEDKTWVAGVRERLAATSWTLAGVHVVTLDGTRPLAA